MISLLIQTSSFAKTYSYEKLVALALDKNLTIKRSQNNIEIGALEKTRAYKNLFLPKLYISADYKNDITESGPLTQTYENTSAEVNDPALFSTSLNLSYSIFNGLKDWNKLQEEKIDYQLSTNANKVEKENLLFKLKSKYLDLSQAMNKKTVLLEELERTKTLLKSANIKFQKGHITKLDRDRAELENLQALTLLQNQDTNIENNKTELYKIINIDTDETFSIIPLDYLELDRDLKRLSETIKEKGILVKSLDYFEEYLKKGSTLRSAALNLEKSKRLKEQVLGEFSPSLSVSMRHNYYFDDSISNRSASKRDLNTISVNINIPLFDNFDHMISYKEQKLDTINKKHTLKQTKIQTKKTIVQLCRTITSNYQTYKNIKRKYVLRKSVYERGFKRYSIGAITIKDLIEDKISFLSEALNLQLISYNLRRNRLQLQKITGTLL